MKRQTLTFGDAIEKDIEDFRRKQTPIPSFNAACLELLAKGLKAVR